VDYRELGGTGVRVSTLCLGAVNFGSWGNTDHATCIRFVHRALDAGINLVGTADMYSVRTRAVSSSVGAMRVVFNTERTRPCD